MADLSKGITRIVRTLKVRRVYTLQASGPGGNAVQQVSVNVQMQPPPPTQEPIVPTEEPIVPTEEPVIPTPVPVIEPPVIQNFSVEPSNIEPGQCVRASWTTGGGTTRVLLLRDGAVILDNAQLNNSIQDCPTPVASNVVTYILIAYNNAGQQESREMKVEIAAAPAPPPPTEPPPTPSPSAFALDHVHAT